jgi:ankyrin repeat protein
MLEILLAKGASTEAKTESGDTALHLAAHRGQAELVRPLLTHGARADAKNAAGKTPLDLARQPSPSAERTQARKEVAALLEAKPAP